MNSRNGLLSFSFCGWDRGDEALLAVARSLCGLVVLLGDLLGDLLVVLLGDLLGNPNLGKGVRVA